ncbi:MAG: hypothetical protein L0312_17700, partial [Acidobacteria bacterium]|nr:hypothetical protein [Acidobacteriota bacterium]
SIGGFRKDRSHHPGAGCASARPSSAEEGSQHVQSSDSRLRGNDEPGGPVPLRLRVPAVA